MMSKTNNSAESEKIRLIVRGDDFGMTHACNMAVKKCFEEGILTCAAIQAPAPWAEEAVAMSRKHPEWCVGVHLTTIGEWVGYRWRPVLSYDKVSTLVDDNGFLHQTVQEFYSKIIDYDQLEKEFLAQINLITKKWGLKVSYIDNHYIGGNNPDDKNYRDVMKRVSETTGLPISGSQGERWMEGFYFEPVWRKEMALIKQIESLTPGLWMLVDHLLLDCMESQALFYGNPLDFTEGGVGNHRAAEAGALLSLKVKEAIAARAIELVNYRDIK